MLEAEWHDASGVVTCGPVTAGGSRLSVKTGVLALD
jgi:hypothetical protein